MKYEFLSFLFSPFVGPVSPMSYIWKTSFVYEEVDKAKYYLSGNSFIISKLRLLKIPITPYYVEQKSGGNIDDITNSKVNFGNSISSYAPETPGSSADWGEHILLFLSLMYTLELAMGDNPNVWMKEDENGNFYCSEGYAKRGIFCYEIWGDGILSDDPQTMGWDDGNLEPGDGCSQKWQVEPNYVCIIQSNK